MFWARCHALSYKVLSNYLNYKIISEIESVAYVILLRLHRNDWFGAHFVGILDLILFISDTVKIPTQQRRDIEIFSYI